MNPEEIDLRDVSFTAELLSCLPGNFARRFRVLPVGSSRDELVLAMADVSDLNAIDSVQRLTGRDVAVCVAKARQLDEFIERLYGKENGS